MLKRIFVFFLISLLFCIPTYANEKGTTNMIIEYMPQYTKIEKFHDGYAVINNDNDYNIIDYQNSKVMSNNYEYIEHCGDLILCVKQDATHGEYIDITGKTIFELDEELIGSAFQGEYAAVFNYETFLYGLINNEGQIILPCEYTKIIICNNQICVLKKDSKSYIYDIQKSEMKVSDYNIVQVVDNLFIISNNKKYGIMDMSYDVLTEIKYNSVQNTDDGYIKCYYDDMVDIYDNKGNKVIAFEADILDYVSGVIDNTIWVNNTYYCLDGNTILTLPKGAVGDIFKDNYAVVRYYPQIGGETYINKNGVIATNKSWDKAYTFSDGYALVMNYVYDDAKNVAEKQWYIINTDFEIVKTLQYDIYIDNSISTSCDFSDGYIRTIDSKTGKMGFMYLKDIAVYEKDTYALKYNSNGGDGTILDIDDIPVDSTIELPYSSFTRSGYTFSHWTDGTANYNPGDTFIMPDHDVTMTAVWKKNAPVEDDEPETDNDKPSFNWFPIINQIQNKKSETEKDNTTVSPEPDKYVCSYKDISGHWAKDIIQFIDELDLIDGITSTQFQPNEPMTREMFVTAVARLAGVESDYVSWAINNGILLGYGNGEYGLTDTVTREQMAVFFLRYFEKMGIDVDDFRITASYTFADDENISDWASGAVYEIQSLGLIKGKGNNIFDPQGTTTRAEAATVLYNLIQTVLAKIN